MADWGLPRADGTYAQAMGPREALTWEQAAEMVRKDAEAIEARRTALAEREGAAYDDEQVLTVDPTLCTRCRADFACEHNAGKTLPLEWPDPGIDDQPAKCDRLSCGATRAEYDRDPCKREWCPMRDDARPAAAAGCVGEDVYRAAGQAMVDGGHEIDADVYAWHACDGCPGRCSCAGIPYPSAAVRAAIDAARAPLLAELAEVTRERDETRAKAKPLRQFAEFLLALDEPGSEARRTITLNQLIGMARDALGPVEPVTDDGSDRG